MIRKKLEKLPYPIAGVMLALATLGNLLGGYNSGIKTLLGSLSVGILVLLSLKIILLPKSVNKALKMLPIASVMATLPMGMMVLTTYTKGFMPEFSKIVWWVALLMNVGIMIYFTIKHVLPLKVKKVYASYFVTYIGIAVAAVTAQAFGAISIGKIALIIGLLAYLVLLPIVTYRYLKDKNIGEPLKPLIAIYAAPANLLVVGYLSLKLNWSNALLDTIYFIGVMTTLFVWYQIFRLRRLPFYASFAAYTFPLAIGAAATKAYYANFVGRNGDNGLVELFGWIQLAIACGVVTYVLIRYVSYMFGKKA